MYNRVPVYIPFFVVMDYKNILEKVKTEIQDHDRPAARSFLLQEKKNGTPATAAWKMCKKMYNTHYKVNTEKKPERVSGDVIGGTVSSDLDKIKEFDLQEIETKINRVINDFEIQIKVDDMTKATQRQFTACSMYVGQHVFKGTRLLKIPGADGNKYDIDKLIQILNLYTFICTKYNKAFTLDAAAYFCGVSDNYITEHKQELTARGFNPNKKAEDTIAAGLLDGKINAVGSIAWLNYNARWSQPLQNTAPKQVQSIAYPVLGASDPDNNGILES